MSDSTNQIEFTVEGDDLPLILNLVFTSPGFPPFQIDDVEVTNGMTLNICLEGILPAYDPGTNTVSIPILAVGLSGTVQVMNAMSNSGCDVTIAQNSLSLNFIAMPTVDAGPDQTICEGENVSLNGTLGGSATTGMWSTAGDGVFSNPNLVNSTYTPGSQDVSDGEVELTLTAQDANGACIPVTSSLIVTIEPSAFVETNSPLTVCDNDVAIIEALITGGTFDGIWESTGDGQFDDPNDPSTVYEPGFMDIQNGTVLLTYVPVDPDQCVATNEPLVINFVPGPEAVIPLNPEVCSDESIDLEIFLSGNYTNVTWGTLGDGTLMVQNDELATYTPGAQDIDDGFVGITITVMSAFPECGQTTFIISLFVVDCDCPILITQPPAEPLCGSLDSLDLDDLIIQAEPGTWSITSSPPGSNPVTIQNGFIISNDADPGNYTLTYTLDFPVPGCPETSEEILVVQGPVSFNAGNNMNFCDPDSMMVAGSVLSPGIFSNGWLTEGDGTFLNNLSANTFYFPGQNDLDSGEVQLIFFVNDPVCGTQYDTIEMIIAMVPEVVFNGDTITICNEADKGSVINFSQWIVSGDMNGQWISGAGQPVIITDPTHVDFDGVAEGFYIYRYLTQSAVSPCMDSIYSLVVAVEDCDCPFLQGVDVPGICNSDPGLPLAPFVMAGGPGQWSIVGTPPGGIPAVVTNDIFMGNGADPGQYRLRFTLDAAPLPGCADSVEITLFLQEQPAIEISGDTATCGQDPFSLTATLVGSASGVQWSTLGSGVFQNDTVSPTTYTPSVFDVASAHVMIIAATTDTLGFCPVRFDTVDIFIPTPPSTQFTATTDTVCTDPDSSQVLNLSALIASGDGTGFWVDLDLIMVDLTDPTAVDFEGVPVGTYQLAYWTQSATPPCEDSVYIFEIVIQDCACPPLSLVPGPVNLCVTDFLNLDDLILVAAPGEWSVISGPAGNWPMIQGNELNTNQSEPGLYELQYTLDMPEPGCPVSDTVQLQLSIPPSVMIGDIDCDPSELFYSVEVISDANAISTDAGVVSMSQPGVFIVDSVPAGATLMLIAQSLNGICPNVVSVQPPNCNCTLTIEDLQDTIRICPGDTFTLIPFVTGATGFPMSLWIGEDTIKWVSFDLTEEGTFVWVVMDEAGCEERDTFYVRFIGPESLAIDAVPPSCPGMEDGSITLLNVVHGAAPFDVQLDSEPPLQVFNLPLTFNDLEAGLHLLSVTDLIGCTIDTTILLDPPVEGAIDLGSDRQLFEGDSVLITLLLDDIVPDVITWFPNVGLPGVDPFYFGPDMTTQLVVTVIDENGCSYQDSIWVTILERDLVYIPTVFSPNFDGINDFLVISSNFDPDRLKSLEVFDRWGGLLFRQVGNTLSWDGISNGKAVPPGVYVVKVVYENIAGETEVLFSDLTVIR